MINILERMRRSRFPNSGGRVEVEKGKTGEEGRVWRWNQETG